MAKVSVIQNGTIVTGDSLGTVLRGDILIQEGHIRKIARRIIPPPKSLVIDAMDKLVIPGFVQAHIHLCQTLFRGLADDLSLLDWLSQKIWPYEKAHTAKSLAASAQLGALELMLSGTTSILDMGTVRYTHELLESISTTGLRYWGGKCLMDVRENDESLGETTADAIAESESLISEWENKNALIKYSLCPRFVLSCSEDLLDFCRDQSQTRDLLIHSHASENLSEIQLVRDRTGRENIEHFAALGLLSNRTVIAHGIHLSDPELHQLVQHRCSVVHCPSSNLKLASGVARIHEYLRRNLNVALGADGAACSNTLDPFLEMRLTALLQKPLAGADALTAKTAFYLATMGGARALNADDQIGSLEPGKRADIVVIDRNHPSVATVDDPYSALVYSCTGRDVRHVFVNGHWVVKDKKHRLIDQEQVIYNAKRELKALIRRA